MKVLFVVDMQNDFITGALKNDMAAAIIPNVCQAIREARAEQSYVFLTQDCHDDNYLETQEGRRLPIPHCLNNSHGYDLVKEVKDLIDPVGDFFVDKGSFGEITLANALTFLDESLKKSEDKNGITEIKFVGICTDICVISNAFIAKAALPEARIVIDRSACAGTSVEAHETALKAMENCQMDIIGG